MADVPRRRAGSGGGELGPWCRDARVVTTTVLTTTGGTVWGAAHRAIDFFEAMAAELGMTRPGVRILELGAGCGLLGLTLARNLPRCAEVCLTEQAAGGALDHLRANVAANAGMPGVGAVTTAACDWTLLQGPAGGTHRGEGGARRGAQTETAELQAPAAASAAGPAAVPADSAAQAGLPPDPAGGAADQRGSSGAPAPPPPAADGAGVGGCGCGVRGSADPDTARLLSARWDVVVGSDLVYNAAGTHMLPRVFRALALAGRAQGCGGRGRQTREQDGGGGRGQQQARPGSGGGGGGSDVPAAPCGVEAAAGASRGDGGAGAAAVFYAHTKNRLPACDEAFLEQAAAAGLAVEEVREPGFPSPPPSPPPFTELFPEMRCLVYQIRVLPEGGGASGSALTA